MKSLIFFFFFFLIDINRDNQTFAATRPSAVLLEQLSVCVTKGEPVLLVGETGTGKTSTVQHLARVTGELRNIQLVVSSLHGLISGFSCHCLEPQIAPDRHT